MRNIILFTIGLLFGFYGLELFFDNNETKPISYPEEIQAVRAGDTLYVSSVSDSIYIGFKQFKNK
jgi:hypothetical protein